MTFLQSRNLFKKLSMIAIALLPLFCLTTAVAPAKASTLFQGDLTVETMTPGDLISVTCISSTNCIAVGFGSGNPANPIFWTGDPSKWTAGNAYVIDLTSLGGGYLNTVTCSSSTNCVGVGGTFAGDIFVWTGDPSKWTAGNAYVIDLTSLGGGQLYSVTCSSSTNCVAVGSTNGIPNEPIVWTGDPSKWTAGNANVIDLTSLGGGVLYSVTCSSSTNCVGVGNTFGSLQYPVIYSFVAPSFGIPWGWGYSPEVINVPTPDAPTNLSVSTPRSGGIITLSWSPVAENGSGPITSYVCSSGAAVTISVTGTSCTFTNKSLIITNNSASLSVVAVNQSGTSDPATLPVQWASPPTTTTTTTTPVITTKTITCHKGIHLKKVTGVTPVCPSGWKK